VPVLRYTTEALDNLADIAAYIAEASGSREIAERFTSEIRQKCLKLASLPGTLGRARPELRPNYRSFVFKGYVVFFRYVDNVLEVISVLEGHRDIVAYFKDDEA